MTEVFVGLGSNIGDRAGFLKAGVEGLRSLEGVRVVSVSSIYRTDPVGPVEQGVFFNAVTRLETDLDPEALLEAVLTIERANGRRREERWGPRTLDLDLLSFGEEERSSEQLTLPHPRMWERAFVLVPLVELAQELEIGGRRAAAALNAVGRAGVERLISFDASERVGVVGASAKPDRYSNRALRMLMDYGHSVVPVSIRDESILDVPCVQDLESIDGGLDTVTMYVSPARQDGVIDALLDRPPRRVIFNPGTESPPNQTRLREAGIEEEEACTLVLLQTGQF